MERSDKRLEAPDPFNLEISGKARFMLLDLFFQGAVFLYDKRYGVTRALHDFGNEGLKQPLCICRFVFETIGRIRNPCGGFVFMDELEPVF
jgi:hypothetical protein